MFYLQLIKDVINDHLIISLKENMNAEQCQVHDR